MSNEDFTPDEGESQQAGPASPFTPPTQPGPLARPANYTPYASAAPVWPTTIGVIGMVFGAGAILLTLGGTAISLVMLKAANAPPAPQFSDRWMPWSLASLFVTCAVAILILIAGIGIAKRRPWGPRAAKVWAVVKIIFVVASTVYGYQMQKATVEAMQQSSPASPVPDPQMLLGFGMCVGLVWGWALPVFLLIWFGRASVKEEISKWS